MGFKDKVNNFFALDDEEMKMYEEETTAAQKNPVSNVQKPAPQKSMWQEKVIKPNSGQLPDKGRETNVVSMNQQSGKKPRIKVIEPRVHSEVQEIADLLLDNQSVVLNFRRSDNGEAMKMIDFLMGTVYAINGDIQRIGDEIFLCTPSSVEIDGTELNAMTQHDFY